MMKKMIMSGGGGGGGGGKKEEKKRDDNFKIRAKTRQQQQQKMTMMMKNMVQIHDEQRSIQMTISNRNTHKNTAQTITVIINNESKNSKYRPKSDTINEKRQQQCEPFK